MTKLIIFMKETGSIPSSSITQIFIVMMFSHSNLHLSICLQGITGPNCQNMILKHFTGEKKCVDQIILISQTPYNLMTVQETLLLDLQCPNYICYYHKEEKFIRICKPQKSLTKHRVPVN